MTAEAYLNRAADEFRRNLENLGLEELTEHAPEDLGRRAALAVAAEAAWQDRLGPLLTSAEARLILGGVSREALRKQVERGRVLALRDERGRVRYPAWQFDPAAEGVHPIMGELIERFRAADVGPWMLASFCVTAQPEVTGRAPAQAWREGEHDAVLEAAERALHELTR